MSRAQAEYPINKYDGKGMKQKVTKDLQNYQKENAIVRDERNKNLSGKGSSMSYVMSPVPYRSDTTRDPIREDHGSGFKKKGGNLVQSSSVIEKIDEEHIYYNVTMANTTKITGQPATYMDYRTDPIVKKPNDYKLSVTRFYLPTGYIPLFIYPNNLLERIRWKKQSNKPIAAAHDDTYYVTLSYDGEDYTQNLVFEPENKTQGEDNNEVESYYEVHSFQQFVRMINVALLSAYNAMKTDNAAAPNQAPYMIFNHADLTFSIIVPKSYEDNVQLYFNVELNNFFNSFEQILEPVPAENNKDIQLVIKDNGNNSYSTAPVNIICTTNSTTALTSAGLFTRSMDGSTISGQGIPINTTVTYNNANSMTMSQAATTSVAAINVVFTNSSYLEMRQEFPTAYLWVMLKSIVLLSDNLRVRSELLPVVENDNYKAGGITAPTASNNFVPTISDFIPTVDTGPDVFSGVTYTPTAQYRYIDLLGEDPITNVNVSFYWSDSLGVLRPIYIPINHSATIKILFQKKTNTKEKSG